MIAPYSEAIFLICGGATLLAGLGPAIAPSWWLRFQELDVNGEVHYSWLGIGEFS